MCGVRPDVACRHRAADTRYRPPVQDADPDRRRKAAASGGGSYPLGDVLRNRRKGPV